MIYRRIRVILVRLSAGLAAALLLAACVAQDEPVGLAIAIDRRCTTCDDFVACKAAVGGAEAQTVYHLQPRSFMAQVETIIDYLLQAVWQRRELEREVRVFSGAPAGPTTTVAAVDLAAHRLRIADRVIDQTSGDWLDSSGVRLGTCRLLPLAEGRSLVAAKGPGVD